MTPASYAVITACAKFDNSVLLTHGLSAEDRNISDRWQSRTPMQPTGANQKTLKTAFSNENCRQSKMMLLMNFDPRWSIMIAACPVLEYLRKESSDSNNNLGPRGFYC